MADTTKLRAHSNRALDALHALEARSSASKFKTLDLTLPPRPVPRRKKAFISPQQPAAPPPAAPAADIVLDGFVLLEACRVEDPDEAEYYYDPKEDPSGDVEESWVGARGGRARG